MITISFRASTEEARNIRDRAKQERLTVSEFLRRQAMAPPKPSLKIAISTCRHTGAKIFVGTKELPPLTVESTRELLTDFP